MCEPQAGPRPPTGRGALSPGLRPVRLFDGCFTAASDQWENGESISSADTGQASIMEPRPTRIKHVRPAATNRPRSERTRAPVTRSAARSGSRMRFLFEPMAMDNSDLTVAGRFNVSV